jgi:hypothetical protein
MISVFTPTHSPTYLAQCEKSLSNQTYTDFEWIVYENKGIGVGAAKWKACDMAHGDILVELDHDDELAPTCLEKIIEVFNTKPQIGFVYSDCAQINPDGSPNYNLFDLSYGWEYYKVDDLLPAHSMAPYPHNVSYIWYAPNHVRAFHRSVYEQVEGYDPSKTILDDQDLMCRLYEVTDFYHIPEPLYLQRIHPANTQVQSSTNARIQTETVELYDKYIQRMALAWAKRSNLKAIDLGAAHNKPSGYIGLDLHDADILADVSDGIPLPDNSVGVIRAVDFLEHIPNKVAIFNELYRVLAHGGLLLSLTPSTDGRGAFQDPTHCSYYNENSFWYYTDESYSKFVPEITCKFQVSRLHTYYPTDWHRDHLIPYVNANLIAIKSGPRQGGILNYA